MESTLIYAILLYLMGFRLLVILLGGMSIYLGYRLFAQAVGRPRKAADKTASGATGADMEARFGENQLSLKNAAPGIFFVAFGAAMVIVILASSPPAASFKAQGMSLATEGGGVTVAATDGKAPIGEFYARSSNEVPETADAAHKLAGQQLQDLLKLEKHAVALDPQNPEYLDSLAGLYFVAGKLDLALQHQEKATQLAPQREDMRKRLAAYRLVGQTD